MSNLDKKYSLRLDLKFNFTNSVMKFDEFDINTSDFFIRITRNKELIDISEAIVTLVAIKPDGSVDSQFVTITENEVYCDLKPSMKDIPGKYEAIASITIAGETINTDPTNPVIYEVTENKFLRQLDAAVISEERFSILTDMINKLSTIQNQENDRVEAEKLREENSKKAIEELNNISKNFDKTIFEKVNAKVDEVIEPTLNEKLPSIVSNKIESIKDEIKGEQGKKGEKGEKGEIGPKGETGATGQKGENGERGEQGLPGTDGQDGENGITPNITIGTITTLEPNQQATVTRRGTDEQPIFDFSIPRGRDGEDGGNANIDDTQVSTDKTWSSDKISTWSMEQDGVFWTEKEGNFISVDDTYEYKLKEIEIFGDTWQDENNLEDIQHAGELYTDEQGKPILDAEGREQYKFDIGSAFGVNLANAINPQYQSILDGTTIKTENGYKFTNIRNNTGTNINFYMNCDKSKTYTIQMDIVKNTMTTSALKFLKHTTHSAITTVQNGNTQRVKFKLEPYANDILFYLNIIPIVENEYLEIENLIIIEGDYTNLDYDIEDTTQTKQTILLPCQLSKVGDVKDRLYWDESKGRYIVEKKIFKKNLLNLEWTLQTSTSIGDKKITIYRTQIENSSNIIRNDSINLLSNSKVSSWNTIISSITPNTFALLNNNQLRVQFEGNVEECKLWANDKTIYYELGSYELIETNITTPITIPTFSNKTHVYVVNSNNAKATIKAKFPLKTASAVASLNIENVKNSKNINELQDSNVDLIGANFEIDFRLSEVEWTLEDAGLATPVTALKNIKLGGNEMALTRFEQAKILILAGEYDKERMTYQLTRYLERGYIKQSEYDELISLMEAKELVVGE